MFSPPSPFSPVSSAQLAVAALFGASVMAISAFYIHKRSVDQVLDRLINIRRRHHDLPSDDEHCEFSDFDENSETDRNIALWTSRHKLVSSSEDHVMDGESDKVREYRVSSSMPNYSAQRNERGGEEDGVAVYPTRQNTLGKLDSISSDLLPVRINLRDGVIVYLFVSFLPSSVTIQKLSVVLKYDNYG